MSPARAVAGDGVAADAVHTGMPGLTLAALGVVFGDIGTSPLYTMRESVTAAVGVGNPASEAVVLGILSLVIWALLSAHEDEFNA